MIKHVLLLDDDEVQNQILIDGYLKVHPISRCAKVDVLNSPKFVNEIIKAIRLDLVVLDYYLGGATCTNIASFVRSRQPDSKIWLYSGYNPEFLHDHDKSLFDRCIEKDKSQNVKYLLDQLYDELHNHKKCVEVPIT